jgi:hypothetical protein
MSDREREIGLSSATRRAEEARQLLSSTLFIESLDALRTAYIDRASGCSEKDDLGRYRLMEGYKMVEAHLTFLKAIMENGKLAQAELDGIVAARGIKRILPKF